jgi:hypothetical protein
LSPDSASRHFLALECAIIEEPQKIKNFIDLSARFPEYPLITRGLGMYYFSIGELDKALIYLKKAFADNPQTLLSDMVFLARLAHYAGEPAAIILSEMGPWSPQVRALAETEVGAEALLTDNNSDHLVWSLMAQGRISEAVKAAGPRPNPNTIILAAASDGAPPELLGRLTAIDPRHDLNPQGAWTLFGILLKNGADSSLVEDYLMSIARNEELVLGAILLIKENRMEELLHLMRGHDPLRQGYVALAAHLAYPDMEIEDFRKMAKGFLFIGERPYLR